MKLTATISELIEELERIRETTGMDDIPVFVDLRPIIEDYDENEYTGTIEIKESMSFPYFDGLAIKPFKII